MSGEAVPQTVQLIPFRASTLHLASLVPTLAKPF